MVERQPVDLVACGFKSHHPPQNLGNQTTERRNFIALCGGRSSARLERRIVTPDVEGSNPSVRPSLSGGNE
jgi:hypothetical protein